MATLHETDALDQGAVLDGIEWTGIVDNPPLGIVLSSTCDLEHGKADFIFVAALKPARGVIQSSKEFLALIPEHGQTLTARQWRRIQELLEDHIHNANVRRYFFVEAHPLGLEPLLADFQHLTSVPIEDARQRPVIAALTTPDREKLVMHFAAYSGRIGVDRMSEGEASALVHSLAAPYSGAT